MTIQNTATIYNTPGVYNKETGLYNGAGVYNDGAGGGVLDDFILLTYFEQKENGVFKCVVGDDSFFSNAYIGQEITNFNFIGDIGAGVFEQYGQPAGQLLLEYNFDVDVITIDYFIKNKSGGSSWGGAQVNPEKSLIINNQIYLGNAFSSLVNYTLYNGWVNVSYGFIGKSGVENQAHIALVLDKNTKEVFCFCNGELAYKISDFSGYDNKIRRTGEPSVQKQFYWAQLAVRKGDFSNNRQSFDVPTRPYI